MITNTEKKLIAYFKAHTLRKVFLLIWLAFFAIGVIAFLFNENAGGNAIVEVLSSFIGVTTYLIAASYHCIIDENKSTKIGRLFVIGLILFLVAFFIVAFDNILLNLLWRYSGEGNDPILVIGYTINCIQNNTIGMLLNFGAVALMGYSCWDASMTCKKRYRYIFILILISLAAYFVFCLSIGKWPEEIAYSEGAYSYPNTLILILALWIFTPGLMAWIVFFKEGKSSVETVSTNYNKITENNGSESDAQANNDTCDIDKPKLLSKLKELFDNGVLSQDEFDTEKHSILNNGRPTNQMQQIIKALTETNQIYEAGILTKEEMEEQKNKILHSKGQHEVQSITPKENISTSNSEVKIAAIILLAILTSVAISFSYHKRNSSGSNDTVDEVEADYELATDSCIVAPEDTYESNTYDNYSTDSEYPYTSDEEYY